MTTDSAKIPPEGKSVEKEQEPDSTLGENGKKNEAGEMEIDMGGADFEAEQERVLQELNKQKDTIKALLDEMQQAKKERLTYNIKSIFAQK